VEVPRSASRVALAALGVALLLAVAAWLDVDREEKLRALGSLK